MESTLSATLLDMLPFGIAVLNARARILFTNAYACTFLNAGAELFAKDGVLQARSFAHKRILSETLDAFVHADHAQPPIGFTIARTDQRPVSIALARLPRHNPNGAPSKANPRIVLILSDPDFHYSPNPALANHLYGLTPAESQISILMMEMVDTGAIAQKLGITRNTLRDHLKSIFLKTQTRNQGELLQTLLRSPLSLKL